jgi:hypothetical protein
VTFGANFDMDDAFGRTGRPLVTASTYNFGFRVKNGMDISSHCEFLFC